MSERFDAIEMYDTPTKQPQATPLSAILRAVACAPDREALSAIITPIRQWPEGTDKQAVRAALRKRETELRATPPVPRPLPQPTLPPPDLTWWGAIWASVAKGITIGRPLTSPPQAMARETGGESRGTGDVADIQRAVAGGIALQPSRRPTLTPAPTVEQRAEIRAAVRGSDVVAGARTEQSGILTGWRGSGELTRAQIEQALLDAGLPATWAPAPKSDHFHAAAALATLANSGRIVRAERGRNLVTATTNSVGVPRRYTARWTVGNPNHGQVGTTFGLTVMTAGLTASGLFDLDGNPELCARVRDEYTRRRGEGGVYPAGEVTEWLRVTMLYRFGAVRLGSTGWYVPAHHVHAAGRMLEEIARRWGADWTLPGIPVATTDQLRAGLVRGLVSEAEAVLTDLADERERGHVTPKGAAGFLKRLRDVYERAKGFATLLEPKFTADVRARLEQALAVIEPLCDDSATRFAMMDLK